ncbi:MAG TPA: septum formation family protein [Nocardioidaceae bacterium]|nr:septum formation family protein [Nocardioidaceae bacterium]
MRSHRLRRPLPAALLLAVVATLLLAGCSGGPGASEKPSASPSTTSSSAASGPASASSPASTTPAVPPAPRQAACYRLTVPQLTQPTNASTPVPCRGAHTAQTIYVGTLDTVVDGHAVAVDSATVQRQLTTTCPRKLQEYVGGSTDARRLSRLNVVWYSPTLDQSDQGADWFRCDVIAFAGQDQLAPLPGGGRLHGVLDGAKGLSRYGLCGTAAPGARGFQRVICSRKHSWQAITTIGLAGGARYPGAAAVRKAGDSVCKGRARSRSGNTLKFRYGWEWPTRQQWSRGQHYGFCWVPS